jgi:archaemetzincin
MLAQVRRLALVLGLLVAGACGRAPESDGRPDSPTPSSTIELAASTSDANELERELDEAPAEAPQIRAKVILIPLRSFPDDLLDAVEQALRTELDVEVHRHAVVELPKDAYYAPRKRYRAEKLLDFLQRYEQGPGVKILGLTEVDISTTSDPYPDWGIFGLGSSPGTTAVISSYRLKRKPRDREHVRFRVATVAVHEIGHTFGLPHCDEKAVECVMLDAEGGIENTDSSSGTFGPKCRDLLEQLASPD